MLKTKKNIITVLDVCSSKVVCITAKILPNEKYEIVGLGYTKAEGVRAGIISDLKLAQQSIQDAITSAEMASGIKVMRAYVVVSSNCLVSQAITVETSIVGKDITNRDLNKLLLEAIQICKNQQLEVIHTFACNYILDGHHRILNPIGMFGNRLACKFHILSAPANNLLNLHTCIAKAGLEVENYVSGAYSAGLVCLTQDELDVGVILIDFGAGVTSWAVFENDQLVYVDAIPIGGNYITSDIAKILHISCHEAERIKNLYGSAIPCEVDTKELIQLEVDNHEKNNEINRSRLIEIIHARLEEILNILQDKLQENGYLIKNFVITGGVARTLRLKEMIAQRFNAKVRIGYPQVNLKDNASTLELSTSVGVLKHLTENMRASSSSSANNDPTKGNKMFSWIKKTFLA